MNGIRGLISRVVMAFNLGRLRDLSAYSKIFSQRGPLQEISFFSLVWPAAYKDYAEKISL
jgi:hypothetical protein